MALLLNQANATPFVILIKRIKKIDISLILFKYTMFALSKTFAKSRTTCTPIGRVLTSKELLFLEKEQVIDVTYRLDLSDLHLEEG